MTEHEIGGIINTMEASIRGYTFSMEDAREIAGRFLQIMVDSIPPSQSMTAPSLIKFTPETPRPVKIYDWATLENPEGFPPEATFPPLLSNPPIP